MIEIFEITFLFILFSLFILAPLNIYEINSFGIKTRSKSNLYFNLIINLNVLLFFSILPIQLINYIYLIYITLLIFVFKNYFLNLRNDSKNLSFLNILIFFSIYFVISIDVSAKLNLSWDSKWFWYIKSLFFYQDNTFHELSTYTYNDFHPHFGSYVWAFFRKLSINGYEYYGRLFYVFLYLVSITAIVNNLFKKKIYNVLFFSIIVILHYKYYYLSGLQEILLFSILILTSKFIYDLLNSKGDLNLLFIGLSLNLIIWTKAEGIAFFFIALICLNLIKNISLSQKLKFSAFMIFLLGFKIFIFSAYNIKLNNQPYYLEYLLSISFDDLIYKIINITLYLGYNSLVNVIFIIFPIIILLKINKIFEDDFLKTNLIFYILNIIFIFLAYILRDMEVVYSLETTLDRLIFASSGFYLFFIAKNIKKLFPKID